MVREKTIERERGGLPFSRNVDVIISKAIIPCK
jgi:hypothetical protein